VEDLLDRLRTSLADRYVIKHELGAGGMATVYLAEDLKHRRQVALKLLRPELAAVLGGERFLREIHIAAGLNHPHILALHDSGEVDGLLYYVMPYVAGESLRQRLERQTQLSIEETIETARQVASALDYAHRQGVVHRDIKPENIMLQEGHAVVADFGIARAVRVAGSERLTETGLSLGTPAYMSPEQASGNQDLDSRSDVYSLACVMYEMLAGDPPFTGPTAPAIIARQLVDPVPSLRTVRATVPEELERAIEKALAKVPADRYDTAGAFVEAAGAAVQVEVAPTKEQQVPGRQVTSKWRRIGLPVALVAAAVTTVGILLLQSDWLGRGPPQFTVSNIRPVTREPGLEFQPAISPDGNEVAYVAGSIRNPRIVVRSTVEVGSGGGVQLAEGVAGSHWLPSWTPDGASLHYWACTFGFNSGCDWKEVGKLGGSVRTVGVRELSSRYARSRDGTHAAFAIRDSLFVYSTETGEPELLGVHPGGGGMHAPHSLVWSPDGRLIAYVSGNSQWRVSANVSEASIWVLDVNSGEPVPVIDNGHMNLSPQWLPDNRYLLFVSDRDGPRGTYVVEVGPEGPRGTPQSVPGSSDPHSISISADGSRLAYARFPVAQNIWSIPIPQSGSVSISDAVPVTTGNQVIEQHALSRDGEWIVFDSDIQGDFSIYKQRIDGGTPQLVAEITGNAFNPVWAPDGTEIAFSGGSEPAIRVVSADGGTPEPITDFPGMTGAPSWSPDGLAIAFVSGGPESGGAWRNWIASRERVGAPWNDPVQLTDYLCLWPDWAPDGMSFVCSARDSARVWNEILLVSRNGDVLARHPMSAGLVTGIHPKFSPDGSRIYFHGTQDDGSEGVWWIPAGGGEATKMVAFEHPSLTVLGWPTIGEENIYLTIAEYESDIWVMDLEW